MAVAKQLNGVVFVPTDFVQVLSGNQNKRCGSIGDLRAIGHLQWLRHMRILVRHLRCRIQSQIGVAHLCHRIQLSMRVIFPRYQRQVRFGRTVFVDINLRDAAEQFREHEIAILRFFIVVIGSCAKHVGTVECRHRLLLFRANN